MLKVVLDTNVVVSAMLTKQGLPALLLNLALRRKVRMFYSPDLMAEYEGVLKRRKFSFPSKDVEEILDQIRSTGLEVFPKQAVTLLTEDPTDNRLLEISQEAEADYLITGNKKHFPLVTFQKTKIVSPREFLESEGAHIA